MKVDSRTTRPLSKLLAPFALMLLLCVPAQAAIDAFQFSSEAKAQQYNQLVDELRCPVCLSSNLSGSDSPISADLRREVYRLVEAGKSDDEIRDYMRSRYGDFILYRPRLAPWSIALYAMPVLLLVGGLIVILRLLAARKRAAAQAVSVSGDASLLDTADAAALDQLLARHGALEQQEDARQ